jgi:hypothetical protein
MIFLLLQLAAIAAVAVCLNRWRASVRRRNAQTWDSLLARLRPDWSVREWSDRCSSHEGSNATPEEKWKSVQGACGLWAMFENARVMLEMADYAARNSDTVDRQLLASLRSDAMQIRVCVLTALGKYAFTQVNESICANAFRAASAYAEMTARMTELLQVSAAGMVPDFVAAT